MIIVNIKHTSLLPTSVISTIGAVAEVAANSPILETFAIEDGFAVLSENGDIDFFNCEGKKVSTNKIDKNIVATDSHDGFLTIASSRGEINLISGNSEKEILSGVNCDRISLSGKLILISAEDGNLILTDISGGKKISTHLGHTTIIRISENHDEIAVATDDGKLTIFDNDLGILASSPPAIDDIEVITNISSFREGGFLVSRSSLGAVIDDRPVNRLEFWHAREGLLEVVEIPSRATSLLPNGDGCYVGCFDGELLWVEREKDPILLFNLGYSVTDLKIWEGDILASSWFYARRISPAGMEKWIFEHPAIISEILVLGENIIALVSGNEKPGTGSFISLINPNMESQNQEDYSVGDPQMSNLGDMAFSGMPSENEISMASERNTVNEIDSIIRDINQSLELSVTELSEGEDILEALASSASSINLPPVADAGDDITIVSNEDSKADVILDGSRSYDPDGEIVSWSWISETGRILGEAPIIKVRLIQGTHSFSLSVIDNKGAKSSSKMTVRVV